MKRVLLVDADILAFRASSSVQKDIDWGDGLWTCHAYLSDAIFQFKELFEAICHKIKYDPDEDEVIMCLSDKDNFRKILNPEYKANRKNSRKPTCYKGLVEWIKSHYVYEVEKYFEGDDIISWLAYKLNEEDKDVWVVSGDKDFLTVPNVTFFDFLRDKTTVVDEKTAVYNLMYQVIIGDKADNYFGIPGYGPVKAKRYLDEHLDDLQGATVELYEKEGLTFADYMFNYNMAHLLDTSTYDGVNCIVLLRDKGDRLWLNQYEVEDSPV